MELHAYQVNGEDDGGRIVANLLHRSTQLGFSKHDVSRILTAASELITNIVKYAGQGEVSYHTVEKDNGIGLKFIAKDNGPGIPDVGLAFQEHYSTSRTLGLGLPGVKRLVDELHVESVEGVGTTISFEVWQG